MKSLELFVLRTNASPRALAKSRAWLTSCELERAERFWHSADQDAFVVVRGTLRSLLGCRLGVDPRNIKFERGMHGKPYLPGSNLGFNVSHSKDLAIIGIADGTELGVDIQVIDFQTDIDGIASRYFDKSVVREMNQLQANQRRAFFFRYWARKEAYLKALGTGLSMGLDQFMAAGELVGSFLVQDVAVARGYSAALAYRGAPRCVACFRQYFVGSADSEFSGASDGLPS